MGAQRDISILAQCERWAWKWQLGWSENGNETLAVQCAMCPRHKIEPIKILIQPYIYDLIRLKSLLICTCILAITKVLVQHLNDTFLIFAWLYQFCHPYIHACLSVQSPVSSSWSWRPWSWILFTTSVWWSNSTRQELPALTPGPGRSNFASTWAVTNAASYIWLTHDSTIHMNTRCVSIYCAPKVDALLFSNWQIEHRLMPLGCSKPLFEILFKIFRMQNQKILSFINIFKIFVGKLICVLREFLI